MIRQTLITFMAVILGAGYAAADDRPNIILLLADDQRADTIAALGNDQIRTPNLDRLVERGTSFSRMYCHGSHSGAVCMPSRAMLLTGQSYHMLPLGFARGGGPPEQRGRYDGPLVPVMLRDAGYQTFYTGKWHQGGREFNRCYSHALSVFFGGMGEHDFLPVHDHQPDGGYTRDRARLLDQFSSTGFVDALIEFLGTQSTDDPPFFATVAFTAPHDPRTPPDRYRRLYDPRAIKLPPNVLGKHPFDNGELNVRDERLMGVPRDRNELKRHVAEYYGMISHIDEQVGVLLAVLAELDLEDDTIVIYTSDHGLGMGSHGLLGKQNLYEHSMRTPCLIAGPGIPAGHRVTGLTYLHDLAATILDMAGETPPAEMTAQSVLPMVRDGEAEGREALVLSYRDIHRAIVGPRWKLIEYPKVGIIQLFDLESDPHELHNLADDPVHEDRVARLRAEMRRVLAQEGDSLELPSASIVDGSVEPAASSR